MAQDKQLSRIEAKLDALLEENGLDPSEYGGTQEKQAAAPARELTPAQQQAIDNAPKVTPAVDRRDTLPSSGRHNIAANAPANVAPPAPSESKPTTPTMPAGDDSGFAELGLTADQESALREAGYTDRAALQAATDDDLVAVPTIGKATVTNLRAKLK